MKLFENVRETCDGLNRRTPTETGKGENELQSLAWCRLRILECQLSPFHHTSTVSKNQKPKMKQNADPGVSDQSLVCMWNGPSIKLPDLDLGFLMIIYIPPHDCVRTRVAHPGLESVGQDCSAVWEETLPFPAPGQW